MIARVTDENRQLASSVRGLGQVIDMPEWKKNIMGGSKASFGKKEKKSILEQRQSLPIYRLKDELVKVKHSRVCLSADSRMSWQDRMLECLSIDLKTSL